MEFENTIRVVSTLNDIAEVYLKDEVTTKENQRFFDYADFNIAQALIEDFGASRSLQIAYHLIAHCQKY